MGITLCLPHSSIRNLAILFIQFVATLARLLGPGGARPIVAESLMATTLSSSRSDTGGCLICQDARWLRCPVDLDKTVEKSFGVSPSQSSSRIRSFHPQRMRSESETQINFAGRFTGKIGPP